MSNWRNIEIGKVINFNPSESIKKESIAKKVPMDRLTVFEKKIKGYEFSEYKAGPKFRNGDTLVAKITPCLENGKTAQVDILDDNEVAFGSSEFIVLRESEHTINDYIFYLAKSPAFRKRAISCMEGTSGRKRVNEGALKLQVLPIPDKITQQKIAKVLSDLDAKIELNNRINSELEAMAKTLYDYWFVQFDFPYVTSSGVEKPYKTSGGKMVWNEELKREIPEGWEDGAFGDYCKSTGGFAFKSTWWAKEGLKVVKIKDIQEDNTINLNDLSCAKISIEKIDEKFKARPGNVLIAMTGATVGKFAIIPYTEKPLFVNQRVGYFNLGENPIERLSFLINSLNQRYFREAIFTLASGAAQPNISNEQINNIPLLIPSNKLVDKFNKILSPNYSRILINQKENKELASLRDWLLPMLMNGQVRVGEVEEELGMVAEETSKYNLNN